MRIFGEDSPYKRELINNSLGPQWNKMDSFD